MGLLDNFEKKLDHMVNGAFAKAFKSEVQPVEVASGLQRELDDRATIVRRGQTKVPNIFTVELSPADFERLAQYEEAVTDELADLVRQYAAEQRYTFVGAAEVSLASNATLGTGVFRIRSEVRPGPMPATPAPVEIDGQPHIEVEGVKYPLNAITRLGRGSDVDIRVDDPGVSRHHAEITLGSEVSLRDLGSTNGTLVDGRPISTVILHDGARIQIGSTTLTYRAR